MKPKKESDNCCTSVYVISHKTVCSLSVFSCRVKSFWNYFLVGFLTLGDKTENQGGKLKFSG